MHYKVFPMYFRCCLFLGILRVLFCWRACPKGALFYSSHISYFKDHWKHLLRQILQYDWPCGVFVQVNNTYRGTLSSYAYVIMCIHVLQMRTPPILPCLQRMTPHTYDITIDGKECAYYDRMDKLTLETGFDSSMNKESIAQLVYAFFDYWAWRHNYSNDVVSIRLGGAI